MYVGMNECMYECMHVTFTVYIFYFILTHTNLLITIGINNI